MEKYGVKVIIKKDHINFAVGPVMVSREISAIGAEPVPYFRTSDFSNLMLENEEIFKELVAAPKDSRTVFLTGSGTASMDAAVSNVLTDDDKILVVCGGGFGQRFCEICETYGLNYESVNLQWGHTLTESDLAPYKNKGFTALLINMGETSSGVLYDMDLVGNFCKSEDLILIVDAISTFIADELSMTDMGADVVFTGSQKALALPPGLSIMTLSGRAIDRVNQNRVRNFYLNLKPALKDGERGQTPWTPAVGTLIQLNYRLLGLRGAGIVEERKHIVELANDFRARLQEYPLEIASNKLSNTVTPVSPTNSYASAKRIFETLKDEYGIIVCPNGGAQAETLFRVGHIGNLTQADNDALFNAFDELIVKGLL